MTEKGSKTGDRMTDERKDRTEAIEQLPPEELAKEIEKNKRKVARNIVFIMAAMVAFIAICIAWFVSNNRVNGILGGISAKKSGIEIGSKGRGGVHDDLLQKIVNVITYHLPESGEKEEHDTSKGGSINWLLSDSSNMKNYDGGKTFKDTRKEFRKDYAMEPGTKGKLDFFIKSYEGGDLSLDFTLDITPYTNGETAQPKAVEKTTAAAQLLSGHILYFLGEKQSDETIRYTWIKKGKFHIEIKDAEVDKEYEYSIYWVWPLNLSTILLNKGDEFLNEADVEFDDKDPTGDLRNEIITDMQTNPGRYFFSSLTGEPFDKEKKYDEIEEIPNIHKNSGKSDATYNKQLFVDLSSYYNQADMKIGSEISFIRATLEYTGPSEATTKTTEANNEG